MNQYEFCRALKRLDLTQVGAARLFGYNPRTLRRWGGEVHMPRIVSLVLWLMDTYKPDLDDIPHFPTRDEEERELYSSVADGPVSWSRLPAMRDGGLDKTRWREQNRKPKK